MLLKSKTVLITGAGRGLGRATALALAARGAKTVLVSRTESELEAVAREIRAAGGEAHALVADISDPAQVYPLVGQAAALAGPISVLINNASTLGPVPLRPLLETDCEELARAFATNVLGPFRLAKAVLGSMLARGEGVVVNLSSDAAVSAYADWGAYSLTKAALDHLTRVWAEELQGLPIRLLSFDPGEMDTAMHAAALPGADRSALRRPENVARALIELLESDAAPSGSRIVS